VNASVSEAAAKTVRVCEDAGGEAQAERKVRVRVRVRSRE
jgi:hypothetical protein